MAAVGPDNTALLETGQSSRDLRRQHSSAHFVPKEQHIGGISEDAIHRGFIRKVYGILTAQMAVTAVVCCCFMYNPILEHLCFSMINYGWWVNLLILVPTICVICVLQSKKNDFPINFYLLGVFTLLISADVGFVCCIFKQAGLGLQILEAFVLTMAIFIALSAYAIFSKSDFSYLHAFLFGCLSIMVSVGILGLFIPGLVNNIVYPFFGAILFCGYILYDTHKIQTVFGPDDYIIAAIELYLDIINLFLYILRILAEAQR